MKNRFTPIIIHVIGCLVFLSLPVIFSPDLSSTFEFIKVGGFQRDFLFSLLLVVFFYISYFYLIPKFYFEKKHFLFYALALLGFVLVFMLPLILIHNHHHPHPHPHLMHPPEGFRPPPENFLMREFRARFFQFLIVFVFSLIIRINNRWKQSEREKLNAELSYLKAQINPHFLFNTLNSIYSLAIQNSESTADAVVKLSGMMRYVLSESHNDFVALELEIEYIRNYIDLQRIRFGNSIQLDFEVLGGVKNKEITPLVLIPFVENAFKHGVNAEENSAIKIKLDITETKLFLSVDNNKVQHVRHINEKSSGLGIENTRNRLLFLYPSKHALIIKDLKDSFSVSLELDLK